MSTKSLIMVLVFSAFVIAGAVVYSLNQSVVYDPTEVTDSQDTALQGADNLQLEPVVEGLSEPVGIAATGLEGDSRLYVVQKSGEIVIVNNGVVLESPLLDISELVINDGEQGLLGLAFHPNLVDQPYIYINYTRPSASGRETVIARYTINDTQTAAEAGSARELLVIDQPFPNHNGGGLAFGPDDGYLYVALGDGGSAGDPENNAQNLNSLLGKILRIDVDGGNPYAIADGNPFASDDGARSEIWSYGWRNTWRFSFDRETGDMWVADVGQNQFEEINFEPADSPGGLNYGWRCYEAAAEYEPAGCADPSILVKPVASYEHEGQNCSGSVTGGFVYRGQSFAAKQGVYIFADYCTGRIYEFDQETSELRTALQDDAWRITSFGQDNDGELYLVDAASGTLYQIVFR